MPAPIPLFVNETCRPGLRDPINCNPFSLHPSCAPGFYLDDMGQPGVCPNGFMCPSNLVCKVACKEGGLCLEGVLDSEHNTCAPYGTLPNLEHQCGGAFELYKCPGGSYCPNPVKEVQCEKYYYCREGSVSPTSCPWLSICNAPGQEAPNYNFIGGLIVFLLFAVFFFALRIFDFFQSYYRKSRRAARQDQLFLQQSQSVISDESMGFSSLVIQSPESRGHRRTSTLAPELDSLMVFKQKESTLDLTFVNMGLTLKSNATKKILNSVNGTFHSGCVTAIMGPSGAGKSSLLSALSGKADSYGVVTGTILVNGKAENLDRYRQVMGFVPQDDIMLPELTVQECLTFNAMYRLPNSMRSKAKRDVVRYVLGLLQLNGVRDEIIGDEVNRGISGGQKKRVNIGMELVSDPTLLFLDEPTSGLDSTTSRVVMDALSKFAERGTTVVVVLHQPRYEIFRMFDNVMFLAEGGRTVYLGPTQGTVPHFTKLGYPVPDSVNPADHFMDVIAGDVLSEVEVGAVGAGLEGAEVSDFLFSQWNEQRDETEGSTSYNLSTQFAPLHLPGFFSQFRLCLFRALLQLKRNVRTEVSDLLLTGIAGGVIGRMFTSEIETVARVADMVSLSFGFVGVMSSLRLFGSEKVSYWRESASGINRAAYFLGKSGAGLVSTLLLPIVFLGAFYPLVRPRAEPGLYLGWFIVTMLACQTLGHLVSVLMSPEKAQLAGVVVVLLISLASGNTPSLRELKQMKPFGLIASDISFMRWLQEALFIVEVQAYPPIFDEDIEVMGVYLGYATGDAADAALSKCMWALIPMGLFFRLLTFLALVYLNRDKQK